VNAQSLLSSLHYRTQSRQEAISLYTSKVKFVQETLDKLQATIERKQDNLQSCVGILQMKMQEERQTGVAAG
jgi:prefoldin alpha subunit